MKVDDFSNETASFKDVSGNDYTYYADGSLKSDANKGITDIQYNYLKLQDKVTFSNGKVINFQYDASGKKLREIASNGNITDYLGNIIKKNNVLYQISHDEGRIVNGEYEYNITDHLGNLRVAFKDSLGIAKIVQSNAYGVWGEDLPTLRYINSLKINNFGYLNREFQVETGCTDLVNRQFDNIVGRFTSQDPIIEGQEHLSLYQYGWNNPILRSDADGLMPCCGSPIYGLNVLKNIYDHREQILSFTDVNDATVLSTTLYRGGNGINIDGSKATTADKIMATLGVAIPFVSGSAVKKVGGAIIEGVIDAVKGGEKAEETIKLRHYTSNKGLDGIKNDMEIKAFDQNTVFAEKAKGKPLSGSDAAKKYGIGDGNKGNARNELC